MKKAFFKILELPERVYQNWYNLDVIILDFSTGPVLSDLLMSEVRSVFYVNE